MRVRSLLGDFQRAAYELTGEYGEWNTNIACVRQADGKNEWKAVDGTVLFDAMLENPGLWGEKAADAKAVLGKLKRLREMAKSDPVSPFYAVLLMDGDELGIHMSDGTKQADITKGLAQFTNKVPDIVKEHNGFLVYAGGDDVMALLPLEDALKCAAALRAHYLRCFDANTIPTTLSGAIEYAHIKMPLGKVLHDAHDLLDNLAKDGRGRDAIACRVWKPGGLAVEWAMPWECALEDNEPGGQRIVLDRLAQDFRETAKRAAQAGSEEQGHFASKFFFRIRGLFDVLNPKNCGFFTETELSGQDASYKPVLEPDKAVSLMAAEYLDSGAAKVKKLDKARDVVRPLLEQCRPVIRDKTKEKPTDWTRSNCLDADGALLLRFLAQGWNDNRDYLALYRARYAVFPRVPPVRDHRRIGTRQRLSSPAVQRGRRDPHGHRRIVGCGLESVQKGVRR